MLPENIRYIDERWHRRGSLTERPLRTRIDPLNYVAYLGASLVKESIHMAHQRVTIMLGHITPH